MVKCDNCICNKVCDHNKYGFENCNNFKDKSLISETVRKNPQYPPWYCFTVKECPKCGELYEPICKLKHICRKQNSYPVGLNVEKQKGDENV